MLWLLEMSYLNESSYLRYEYERSENKPTLFMWNVIF